MGFLRTQVQKGARSWGMERFLKVSTEEADGISRVEVQRDGKSQSHARICQSMCASSQPAPLPIFCPHQGQSEHWGEWQCPSCC